MSSFSPAFANNAVRLILLALAALAAAALSAPAVAEQQVPLIGDKAAKCGKPPVEIYRDVAPSVVQVFSFGIDPYQVIDRVRAGTGSGVYIGDD
ncbi:MAG: hypothetical protein PVH25_15105, partial [Burkholderiales bacterium]